MVQLGQREIVQPALQKGDIDVVPEYVSSMLNFYKAGAATADEAKNLSTLKQLAEAKGVTVYTPAPATDNYAYVVSKDFSDKNKHHHGVRARRVLAEDPDRPRRHARSAGTAATARSAWRRRTG